VLCQACGTPIEFWTPDPGEQIQLGCPDCDWSTTLSIDVK
jgi:phage baseplate assembly protein gpV